jgi:hypothetical protein
MNEQGSPGRELILTKMSFGFGLKPDQKNEERSLGTAKAYLQYEGLLVGCIKLGLEGGSSQRRSVRLQGVLELPRKKEAKRDGLAGA